MASDRQSSDWRIEKYVDTLQTYLAEMRKLSANKPADDKLLEYTKKVDFLRGIIDADKLSTTAEKVMATEMLIPSSVSSEKNNPSRQLHMLTRSHYQKEMRQELLGDSQQNGLRHRENVVDGSGEDLDATLKHHSEMHEKLAEEMVYLARNLKENASTANRVVKQDTKKLAESNKLAVDNFSRLQTESSRLETHVHRSCNCWIWLMLIAVCAIFVWMIIFMRLFPKK